MAMNATRLGAEFRAIYLDISRALNRLKDLRDNAPEEAWDKVADSCPLWGPVLDLEDIKTQMDFELGKDCPKLS